VLNELASNETKMLNGFMSSWRSSAEAEVVNAGRTREYVTVNLLPAVHFHGNAFTSVRRALLFDRGVEGGQIGFLRGFRSSVPEDHVLFDDMFSEAASEAIRPGAVVVPIGAGIKLRRPWREGRVGGDGSLLKLFGAIATPRLTDSGRGLEMLVSLSLPNFQLTRWEPLTGADVPAVAEVSLGIVLCGGDTVREGEHIGFLVSDSSADADVVEPVLLNDRFGKRAVVGMWTLSKRDVWAAAAVFAADSMTRRNTKVGRPSLERSTRRNVHFIVAQFQERVGGDPVFIPCMATLPAPDEQQQISFTAQLTAQATDPLVIQGGILSTNFVENGSDGKNEGSLSLSPESHASTALCSQCLHSCSHQTQETGSQSPGFDVSRERRAANDHSRLQHVVPSETETDNASRLQLERATSGNQGHPQRSSVPPSLVEQARLNQDDVNRRLQLLSADLDASASRPVSEQQRTDSQLPTRPTLNDLAPQSRQADSGRWRQAVGPGQSEGGVHERAIDTSIPVNHTNLVELPGFASRLDTLARKYLGERYRSELNLE
jgi:hypothetical protein